jgi:acyl-CoA synthetase (NDP forming)
LERELIGLESKKSAQTKFNRLLRPRSIALVGASSTPGSLGESVLNNLEDAGFSGEFYLVNPKRPTIRGRDCLGSIDELPDGVDCAVLAIPGAAVVSAVRACATKRFGSAIVFSAGFSEAGVQGREAQSELVHIAKDHNIVIQGPNCLGMVNYVDRIPLSFVVTPLPPRTMDQGTAIISQSGALAAVIAVNMRHHAIPLSYSVSTGNEAVCGVEDFVEHMIGDPDTRAIALVVEQFRQPKRFLQLAHRAREAGQFIVLLHPGRSTPARASAATHTGAIAGDYEVMSTLVQHAGVILAESMEELVDVTQILMRCSELPSGGSAIFTESGAFKALALDLCEKVGLQLPTLSAQAEQALREALPPFVPPSNPLDLTAQSLVDPGLYWRTLPPVLDEEQFGSVLLGVILTDPKTTQLKLPPIVDAVRSLKPRKALIFAALDEGAPFDFAELDELRALGVPCFPSPERAIRALARVTAFALRTSSSGEPGIHQIAAIPHNRKGLLSEAESKQILAQLGIPIPHGALAKNLEDAIRAVKEIGFPVVLKAQSADLPHKSDAGGVILGVQSEEELLHGWSTLHSNVDAARPEIKLDGVLVERMGEKGLEVIIGARNDPQWGPVLLIGAGGVLAEAMGDTRLLPPDLCRDSIASELRKLRCGVLFAGFRGAPPLDIEAVAEIVSKVGRLMQSAPNIVEIDINPVVVFAHGRGAVALDALISFG